MKLIVLGSNSSGNGYILRGGQSSLVIETGMRLNKLKQAINFDLKSIQGALISHAHGDHSKYTEEYLKAGIDCYMTKETAEQLGITKHHRVKIIEIEKSYKIGDFKFMAFETEHDCEGSIGFYINHPEIGNLVFATDTYFLKYTFDDLNYVMIEANYKKEILKENLEAGVIHELQAKRVLKSHFEITNTVKWLKQNDLSKVKKIILLHLSDRNSDAKLFKEMVEEETFIETEIADKGKIINLI